MILSGKRVLITGGSGSLGKAILKRARDENWDTQFTILARNETKISQVKSEFPNVDCKIGDVRDLDWLRTILPGHQVVIHAAALKIVPVAEINVKEAVTCNVEGTKNVAIASAEANVERAILISSDKACGPTYYGVTKRLGEGIFREANNWRDTEFVSVRYGNVLKSANSLVPLLERQMADGKPFTLTHEKMTRFWLSMKQAIDLILFALEKSEAGTITVPKAPAMSIVELAKTLDPNRDIKYIGIRPGERLHETLIVREESMHTYDIGEHFIVNDPQKNVGTNLLFQYEYTSDCPSHWLTSDELKQLLKDS
jgi:UDP-N-acetylglucosamine 4,6-dehydratase